ncbi:MAG: thiamine phosphate synthase [Oscillospiraceae bacterium]|nr:thiamine phosphate synthase [Oscillospiraceae bacterium]
MNISREAMRLYAVSDRAWLKPGESLAQVTETLLQNGVTCFQLREKEAGREEFRRLALEVQPVCARYGVPFIINDDVELALECGADGVHIGQSDENLAAARRLLGPGKIIGVSCHNAAEAKAALDGGADYIGCGAVFATGTKTDVTTLDHAQLEAIRHAVGALPMVAIGGISGQNMPLLKGRGADGAALVSALFAPADKAAAALQLRELAEEIFGGQEKTNMKKIHIFDFDGTIADSMYVWVDCAPNFVRSQGAQPAPDLSARISHLNVMDSAVLLREEYHLPLTPEEIIRLIEDGIREEYTQRVQAKPGVEEVLKTLKAAGCRMGVATGTDYRLVEPCLERMGLRDYFEFVITTKAGAGKDKPDIYLEALEKLGGTTPAEAVVYEDNPRCITTAFAAGFTVCGMFDPVMAPHILYARQNSHHFLNSWQDWRPDF